MIYDYFTLYFFIKILPFMIAFGIRKTIMKNAAKTILLIGGVGTAAYLLSSLGKAATTDYAIDASDIDVFSVQPHTFKLIKSVPFLITRTTLRISNPTSFPLTLTYANLEMYFGKIKFGEIADSTSRTIEANNPRFLLDLFGESSIVPFLTNGLLDMFLNGNLPEDISIRGNLRVNGNLIAVNWTTPFKIPDNFVGVLKERLHDWFPSKNW